MAKLMLGDAWGQPTKGSVVIPGKLGRFVEDLEGRVNSQRESVVALQQALAGFQTGWLDEWNEACTGGFKEISDYAQGFGFKLAPERDGVPMALARRNPRTNTSFATVDILVLDAEDMKSPITLYERSLTIGYKRFMTGKPQDYKHVSFAVPYLMTVFGAFAGFLGGGIALGLTTSQDAAWVYKFLIGAAMTGVPIVTLGSLGFWFFGVRDGYARERHSSLIENGKDVVYNNAAALARIQR